MISALHDLFCGMKNYIKYLSRTIRNGLLIIVCLFSLTISGCFKWSARAHDKIPDTTALNKSYNYKGKVIIVGAGAAGLAAAKVLEQNNIDYLILEAADRYGGRLKKDTTLADFPIDIGAEWIHSAPIVLNKLKGKAGDQIDEELIPYHLEETYNWDGQKYKKNAQSQNNFMFKFMPESKFKNSTWYDFVNENIAATVKHKIQFNSPVTEINYLDDKVQVKIKNGEVHTADKVLLTVSIGVLKSNHITFTPDLSKERKDAINAVEFLPGFKLAMKFTEKFYPDAINCKVKSGEKGFYDIAFKKESQSNILGFLVAGNSVEEYYKLKSEAEIVKSAIGELDRIFDGKASETYTGEYILENWGQHQFTMGTWTQAFLQKESELKTLNQPLDKKVYFAGEINDIYQQMGVPGAVLSGYHSIDRLLTD
jgi:monoamine oxidase